MNNGVLAKLWRQGKDVILSSFTHTPMQDEYRVCHCEVYNFKKLRLKIMDSERGPWVGHWVTRLARSEVYYPYTLLVCMTFVCELSLVT